MTASLSTRFKTTVSSIILPYSSPSLLWKTARLLHQLQSKFYKSAVLKSTQLETPGLSQGPAEICGPCCTRQFVESVFNTNKAITFRSKEGRLQDLRIQIPHLSSSDLSSNDCKDRSCFCFCFKTNAATVFLPQDQTMWESALLAVGVIAGSLSHWQHIQREAA